jgi:predicted nucleic acid-binding protein
MTARCIDASVAVKLVLKGEPFRSLARRLIQDPARQGIDLIAPPIFTCEIDSVIRRRVHEGKLSAEKAAAAYAALDGAPVQIRDHAGLRKRAREIAERFDQRSVYDATYAALAELCQGELWTADKAFFDAVRTELRFVRYLPAYRTTTRSKKRKPVQALRPQRKH